MKLRGKVTRETGLRDVVFAEVSVYFAADLVAGVEDWDGVVGFAL